MRIKDDDQLRALYGHQEDGIEVPGKMESALRTPADIPVVAPAAPLNEAGLKEGQAVATNDLELIEFITKHDKALLKQGLDKLGVSKGMLDRLDLMDGLAESSGKFLSVSLQKTHQLYFVQLIHSAELADALRIRLLAGVDEKGYIASDEARAWLNKNYTDLVKELGVGYNNMLAGAQAMVRMMLAAKGKKAPGREKPRWGAARPITADGGGPPAAPREVAPDAQN